MLLPSIAVTSSSSSRGVMRTMGKRSFLLLSLTCLLFPFFHEVASKPSGKKGKPYIDSMRHDIHVVSQTNFDAVVRKLRDSKKTSAVLHYKKTADSRTLIDGLYNELAKELKGMVKIAAIDCEENEKLCEANNIKEFPRIVVYPPNPIPAFPYMGKLEKKPLLSALTRFISGTVKSLEPTTIDSFLTTHIAIPKVVLFSDKKSSPPLLFRSLSVELGDKMDFGFVDAKKEENAAIVQKYKVTSFPSVLLFRPAQQQQQKSRKGSSASDGIERYKGDINFQSLFDWLNVYSETFVKGGGFSDGSSAGGGDVSEAKPWLIQTIPEMTKASHQDICFKQKGLCVIYLKNEASLNPAEEAMLTSLKDRFTSHLAERGVTFYWAWMNVVEEPQWSELFKVPPSNPESPLPSVVVFNNKKDRKRFLKLDDEQKADESNIAALLDKIVGGDGRFINVKALPKFADRGGGPGSADKSRTKEEL